MKSKLIPNEPHRLYILVRNDLPSMNPGRAMAQAAHASNQLVFKYGKDRRVIDWQGDRGFGTTICLAADRLTIQTAISKAIQGNHLAEFVHDPTYKYAVDTEVANFIDPETFTAEAIRATNGLVTLFRNELTCGYVFIHEDHPSRKEILGKMPLHP
jgi:peptidyl-tRNA hydrolase